MRFTSSEKMEMIKLIDGSTVSANKTLKELGIPKSTFYKWYKRYELGGFDALAPSKRNGNRVWNRIPQQEKNRVVEVALKKESFSSRELAWHITDTQKRYISESSVRRILCERGLIPAPHHIVLSAANEFKKKTTYVNEMWQTDFTYFKIIGWGNYYLCTVLDDYSRFIIAWDLCVNMKAEDARKTVDKAIISAGLTKNQMPILLSDNGSCFIAEAFTTWLKGRGIKPINGAPMHPQTQGKIERYHRTMKNVVKLDNYYSPEELQRAMAEFVHRYNYERYHESLKNVFPADVYYGRAARILKERQKIKRQTIQNRREEYFKNKHQESKQQFNLPLH
jgi:transposase InsO family protein